MTRARGGPLALLLLVPVLAGCVERRFLVRTDPPGAEVTVNGSPAGRTPAEIPFTFYGTVRVEVDPFDRDGDGWPDYRPLVAAVDLPTPWYEVFPLDFFSENLWPWTVVDRHEATLRLEEAIPPTEEGEDRMRREAEALRRRAEERRREAEAEGGAE